MKNPHIQVPYMEDKAYSSMVHLSIQNLRFLLKEALTDEVAAELGVLMQRTFSAGYANGAKDTEYDQDPFN